MAEKMKLKSNVTELLEKCTAEVGKKEADELIKKVSDPQLAYEALSALKSKVVLIDVF
jgi:hypothetical protein